MPEYLAPGLYVEEIDSGSKPIEGVGTNTAAFIGFAKSGEFNKPIFISSWTDFCRLYGEDDEKVLKPLSEETGRKPSELLQAKRVSKKPLLDFAKDVVEKNGKGSWSSFVKKHDIPLSPKPFIEDSYLAYAVQGFYLNGGSRAYIVRVARTSDLDLFKFQPSPKALEGSPAISEIGGYTVKALKAGTQGNSVQVEVNHVEGTPEAFTVKITDGKQTETFGTPAKPLTPEGFAEAVNKGAARSKMVEVTTATEVKTRPEAKIFNLIGGSEAASDSLPVPLDGELAKVAPVEFVGDEAKRTGVRGLAEIDDINMICAPDLMAGTYLRTNLNGSGPGPEVCALTDDRSREIIDTQSLMIAYAENAGDRMVILDSLPGMTPQEIRDSVLSSPFSSERGQAAYYYPWVKVIDEVASRPGKQVQKLIPPCGHVAGVYAKVVNNRGVHKAPANEAVLGVVDLERQVTKGEQAILNPEGINVIRSFPGTGIRIWGARTLATRGNPSWKYVNVRRLFNYLEKSIDRSLQWAVFEPNDPDLWGRVRRTISAFLFTEWKDGKLFGTVPEEAYYVKCDHETNPQEMIDLGRMYVEVGVNPVKPAEFVIIRIGQWAGGSETNES